MATASRIYVVHEDGEAKSLVRARSQSEAIRHVTANRFEAIVADQDHLVRLIGDGIKVEEAKPAPEPEGP
jgi:hypothetical protein